jgi:hypothetical protein
MENLNRSVGFRWKAQKLLQYTVLCIQYMYIVQYCIICSMLKARCVSYNLEYHSDVVIISLRWFWVDMIWEQITDNSQVQYRAHGQLFRAILYSILLSYRDYSCLVTIGEQYCNHRQILDFYISKKDLVCDGPGKHKSNIQKILCKKALFRQG